MKQHNPLFDEVLKRKQAKLQNPCQKNGDNMSNVKLKVIRNSETKRGNMCKKNLMSLKQTVRTEISETYRKA
jgi:hypothetical protein